MRDKYLRGWPEHEHTRPRDRVTYLPVAEALMRRYQTDAHFAVYSAPSVERRLAKPEVFTRLSDGVSLLLFVCDVDDEDAKGKVGPTSDEWWQAERVKLARLLEDHPGAFIYRTRGGYRIIYLLAEVIVLRSTGDAEKWKLRYLAWLAYLERRYTIVGDTACKDWTRLFRLPFVVRDDKRQQLETIGNPGAIGLWVVEVELSTKTTPSPSNQAGPIGAGGRHAALLTLAGAMRASGADEATILVALEDFNTRRCTPPKATNELRDIAKFVCAKPPSNNKPRRSNRDDTTRTNDETVPHEEEHCASAPGARSALLPDDDDVPPPTDDDPPPTARRRKAKGTNIISLATNYVGRYATDAHDQVTLRRWRGDWYRWSQESGAYQKWSNEQLNKDLYRKLCLGDPKTVGAVLSALIAVEGVLIDEVELGGWIGDPPTGFDPLDVAPCRDGLVHLPSRRLIPATPRYFATHVCGVRFGMRVGPPTRWLAFLHELWPDDEKSIATLQEWMGYLLTPDTRYQKILLLLGPKRCGKGTIARVTTALLGSPSVVSPSLASLGTNFGLWPWIGRTAAIIGDARLGGRTDIAQVVERLLSISGEDQQTIDRKHREPWTGQLSTRISLLSNVLPRFTDASDALAARMVTLALTESWYNRENTTLTSELVEELPDIFDWAISGWVRLRDRGKFDPPDTSASAFDELVDLASPIAAWVRQQCDRDVTDEARWVRCEEAFEDFKLWCERTEHRKCSSTLFGTDVKAATGCERVQITRNKNRVWVYRGLALRNRTVPF